MSKSAKDLPGWGENPEGWGKPPEGEATPESVAKNARWAVIGGVISLAAAIAGAVFFLGTPVAIGVGIVSISLGQKARAQGRQLGAVPAAATAGAILGATGALLAPILAFAFILF